MDERTIAGLLKGRKVLVTGGCGFIGRALAFKLNSLGAVVSVFDRRVCDLGTSIRVIQGDITSFEAIDKAMRGQEIVFHLSALLGVENILKIPKEVLDVNLGGTIKALDSALINRVERFVLTSSSEVYGEPRKLPITEDDPTAPVSTYGVSKLASEEYCHAYFKEYGLPSTCIRYFNVYGPFQDEKFVVPIFIGQIAKGNAPVIYGDGNQIRSYTYVDDAVMGTIQAGLSKDAVDQVFNIGNDDPLSISDLAQHLLTIMGATHLSPIYRTFGDGIRVERREVIRRVPDISKARKVLGYSPQIHWRTGIRTFVEWYLRKEDKEVDLVCS